MPKLRLRYLVLIFSILMFNIPGNISLGKLSISNATLLSTLFFSLAHIGINYERLVIESINYKQLLFTIGLGLFYAIMREKSKSLLGPIMAHGISDGSITVIQLIVR